MFKSATRGKNRFGIKEKCCPSAGNVEFQNLIKDKEVEYAECVVYGRNRTMCLYNVVV